VTVAEVYFSIYLPALYLYGIPLTLLAETAMLGLHDPCTPSWAPAWC